VVRTSEPPASTGDYTRPPANSGRSSAVLGVLAGAAVAQAEWSPLAIVLGSVMDGIPGVVRARTHRPQGGVSLSLLTGVALSNLPEGMSSSAGLKHAGWPQRRVLWM
jgi:hypothetical protein